jgi:hypothetical protein
MKKVIYLATLIFSLVLMSASCEKDDTTPDVKKTLEQQYPDWKNLVFNKTVLNSDGVSTPQNPTTIDIKIVGDVVTFIIDKDKVTPITSTFNKIETVGNQVYFTEGDVPDKQYTWEKSGNQIILNKNVLTVRWILDIH